MLSAVFAQRKKNCLFEASSFTLANYSKVFASPVTYRLLLNTAWFAGGTVILAMGLAVWTDSAWFLERTDVPFRRLLFVLILAPMGMPIIITSMAWILLANPANGLFNVMARAILGLRGPGPLNIYSIPGMILVTALNFVPVMYIMISGVFSRIDPSFEEASRTSGGGAWATLRHISMPLLSPALVAAAIFYAVRCIEVFEIPAMLGLPKGIFVFSSGIYYAVNPATGFPDYGLASTYGVVLLVTAGVLIYFYGRHVRHAERFATVTGRGFRPRLIELGRWKFVPPVAMFGYFVFAVGIPLLVMVWSSARPTVRRHFVVRTVTAQPAGIPRNASLPGVNPSSQKYVDHCCNVSRDSNAPCDVEFLALCSWWDAWCVAARPACFYRGRGSRRGLGSSLYIYLRLSSSPIVRNHLDHCLGISDYVASFWHENDDCSFLADSPGA